LGNNKSLKAQERLIEISQILNATDYINAIGGKELYNKEVFLEKDINLSFLKSTEILYKQFNTKFVSNLSIIDVMMFNSKEEIQMLLQKYNLS
jgi:hypothetical protein